MITPVLSEIRSATPLLDCSPASWARLVSISITLELLPRPEFRLLLFNLGLLLALPINAEDLGGDKYQKLRF